MNSSVRNELLRGCVVIAVLIMLSFIVSTPLSIKPNIYLVSLIFLAFIIDDVLSFILFLLSVLAWLKYIPSATPELMVLGVMGVVLFGARKALVRDAHVGLMAGTLFVLQSVFWAFFFEKQIFRMPFFLEFFYNVLVLLIFYSVDRFFMRSRLS